MQLGKFQVSQNLSALTLNCSTVGVGMCMGCSSFHSTSTMFLTIEATVEKPILNENARLLKDAPVARYLKSKSILSDIEIRTPIYFP